jgi:ribonuclease-3 family protein
MEFELFGKRLNKEDARQLNPLVLAFLGDAVYELSIRGNLIIENNQLSAHKLHVKAISYVKAHAQSEAMKKIMLLLSEEELAIYKRGRNTKSATVPKNADVQEYRTATGFETLVGYLYITDQEERLKELLFNVIQ